MILFVIRQTHLINFPLLSVDANLFIFLQIMVSKNNVSRVVDFMIDLQSPDLYNCQYLEQPIACPADGSTATPAEAKGGKTDARERDFQNSQGSSSSV